jgi:hypothetical protein
MPAKIAKTNRNDPTTATFITLRAGVAAVSFSITFLLDR